MLSEYPTAYLALRAYLESLLATPTDQGFSGIPAALRPNLAMFMGGKMVDQNSVGQRMVYAADLPARANDVVHGSGLTIALPLASISVAELQAATSPHQRNTSSKCSGAYLVPELLHAGQHGRLTITVVQQ